VICPECGTRLPNDQIRCHFCGYEISSNSSSSQLSREPHSNFEDSISFFKKNTNLFTIIVAIFTVISLAPLFLTFLYGDHWFDELIGSSLGFSCITLILVASIFGVAFVYYLMWLIVIDFIKKFFRRNTNFLDIVYSGIILILAIISIGSIGLFLIEVWYTKFNSIISLTAVNWLIFVALSAIILLIGVLFNLAKNITNWIGKWYFYILGIAVLIFAIGFIAYPTYQSLSIISNETSKYYSEKGANVKIGYSIGNFSNNTPKMLVLKANIEGFNESETVSSIDRFYAQCHWSANYGFFITINSNNSAIKKQSFDLIIPDCVENSDKIIWSYDLADYGKSKLPVLIGLNFEDPYKKVKNHLGDSYLILNWTNTDIFEVYNSSTAITV